MGNKIEQEKRTVAVMIHLWCRRAEGNRELCPECRELLDYAVARLGRCPHGNAKPPCKACTAHCYKPAMRDRIRCVMRYAGPRMVFYAPLAAIRHLLGM